MSKFFTPQHRSGWVVFMSLITAFYLVVEFSFNARLLDVLGGLPKPNAVDKIETYGRYISGFAIALMIWPSIIKWKFKFFTTTMLILIASAIVITLVYIGEKALVDWMVDNSSPENRYLAAKLVPLREALSTKSAKLENLPLTPAQLADPDGKTFLAIFPLLALSTKGLDSEIRPYERTLFSVLVDHSYLGWQTSYAHFIQSRKELITHYNNEYLLASGNYNQVIGSISAEQKYAWSDYQRKLRRRGLSANRVPRRYWGQIRYEVRDNGVPIPANWNPGDHVTFNRAIAKKIRDEANLKFRDGVIKIFKAGDPVPPNLDKNAFFSYPTVQAMWLDSLKYPHLDFKLPVDLPPNNDQARECFHSKIYNKVVDIRVKKMLREHDAPVATFADSKSQEKMGKDGMRALVVPPIALAFSIFGAIVHVVKLALFVLQLCTSYGFSNGIVKMGSVLIMALILLGSFGFTHTSKITSQPLYQYFETRGAMLGGNIPTYQGRTVMLFCRSTINAEKVAYPWFESIRKLFGLEFDYPPDKSETKVVTVSNIHLSTLNCQ